jgi:hypothetical protein
MDSGVGRELFLLKQIRVAFLGGKFAAGQGKEISWKPQSVPQHVVKDANAELELIWRSVKDECSHDRLLARLGWFRGIDGKRAVVVPCTTPLHLHKISS